MKKRILGRTNLKVRIIGFGGIPIQRVSEQEGVKVVRRCYDRGINYFDTARRYTVSEERVGKALEDVRDKIFLATKTICRTKSEVLEELEISLKNLRTDWIDVYQLHNVSSDETWKQVKAPGGALEALYEARKKDKIRFLGVTGHNPSILTEIVKEDIFDTVMMPYNYLTSTDELLSLCHKMNAGTVIMKAFGGGALTNAKAALKFVLKNENADVVIPGVMNVSEVDENIAVANGPYDLSATDLKVIEKDKAELGNQFCHSCDYCQPCQQKINISFVLNAENMLKRIGWTPMVEKWYQEAETKVPTCIKCGDCESRCPYHLPIRELLPVRLAYLQKKHAMK